MDETAAIFRHRDPGFDERHQARAVEHDRCSTARCQLLDLVDEVEICARGLEDVRCSKGEGGIEARLVQVDADDGLTAQNFGRLFLSSRWNG